MKMKGPKFSLGRLVATPGALEAITKAGDEPLTFIRNHAFGIWGDVDADDKQANDDALKYGSRLLSAYHLSDQTKIWIITEADRSVTTILLPNEY